MPRLAAAGPAIRQLCRAVLSLRWNTLSPLGDVMGRSRLNAVAIVVATLVGLVAGSLLSGAAKALTGDAFNYATPQNGYLMLPAAAFTAAGQSAPYENDGWQLAVGAQQVCFAGPVNLPQGAKLLRIRIHYKRPIDGDFLGIFLGRRNFAGGALETMASSGGQSAPVTTGETTVTYNVIGPTRTINNQTFVYMVNLCIKGTAVFYSARLEYTYLNAGD